MHYSFFPPRRRGLFFFTVIGLVLIITAVFSFEKASQVNIDSQFILFTSLFLITAIPVPFLLYRIYILLRATYHIESDGIRLNWGLRVEIIPINQIEWVSLPENLSSALPGPILQIPGAIIGNRRLPGGIVLEFMGTSTQNLVIIATPHRYYAISPENPDNFIESFERVNEYGSLNPLPSQSIYPVTLIGEVWGNRYSRALLLISSFLCIGLLIWSNFITPDNTAIGSLPFKNLTTNQLIFLPIVNTFFFALDLSAGFFFFRREQTRPLAYLLWGASIITSMLFIGAFYQDLH